MSGRSAAAASKSLVELDGGDMKPPFVSDLVQRVAQARRVPLGQLSIEDLRLLITQRQAVTRLLPYALTQLEADPLPTGHYYRGDLFVAVVSDDWRLLGQFPYLRVLVFRWQPCVPATPRSDHDRCEFCGAKFAASTTDPLALRAGCATEDRYQWGCLSCC